MEDGGLWSLGGRSEPLKTFRLWRAVGLYDDSPAFLPQHGSAHFCLNMAPLDGVKWARRREAEGDAVGEGFDRGEGSLLRCVMGVECVNALDKVD